MEDILISHATIGTMTALVLPLDSSDALLATVGGKGANFSCIARRLPSPARLPHYHICLRRFRAGQRPGCADCGAGNRQGEDCRGASATIRLLFEQGRSPSEVAVVMLSAYVQLLRVSASASPVAVRSSATAEDLPGASFAGQQETY